MPFVPLRYEFARKEIRDGDILLYRVDSSLSNRAIAYFGESDYVHAGMAVWSMYAGKNRLWLLETIQYRGGRDVPLSGQVKGWPGQWDVYRPKKPYDAEAAKSEMITVIGRDYGWWNMFVSALRHTRYISKLLPPLTDDKLDGSAPFCSQAVSAACRAGGRDPRPDHSDIATEPGHLADPDFAEYIFTLFWKKLPEEKP